MLFYHLYTLGAIFAFTVYYKEMDFKTRYQKLNEHQREAVDHIEGPLLVVAGPGTGKTELLSMRTANILKSTDTLPSSILCLTFTDSGAATMRARLTEIIGADAYKVAIHTFHSFGTEIIGQNAEYFYRGAQMQPADELAQYEILREIFDELEYTNVLASKNGEEYTYLKDTLHTISDLKRSGLTSDELRLVLDDAERVIDIVEADLRAVFDTRISKSTTEKLAPIAQKVAGLSIMKLPPAITPYMNIFSLSIAHAVDESLASDSTKPVTAWKNTWLEKNDRSELVFKDRKSIDRLRSVAHVYYEYLRRMEVAELYDYDDMILQVVHALETHPDLAANLREKYLYIMVDEFQDTNLAQLRILFDLTANNEYANIMAVGDDDQGIYSFQGADVSNIHRFRHAYSEPPIVVLTDNYRSTAPILATAREVITQAEGRLETTVDGLSKQLTAHKKGTLEPLYHSYPSPDAERDHIAKQIASLIKKGTEPSEIAVIARRHHELVALLPYLHASKINVNYEKHNDAFTHPIVRLLETILSIIDALHTSEHERADALLPEILGSPALGYAPVDVWKLSLSAHRAHTGWLETMLSMPIFQDFAMWLIDLAARIHDLPFEEMVDAVIGVPGAKPTPSLSSTDSRPSQPEGSAFPAEVGTSKTVASGPTVPEDSDGSEAGREDGDYISPLYNYYFSAQNLEQNPEAYLETLEALRTIRDAMREHTAHEEPSVAGFLDFIAAHRELGSTLTTKRARANDRKDAINLMTAHKSKGLEYDHVFLLGLVDSAWGERVRGKSKLIRYTANLPIGTPGDSYSERIRLAYVAMTRARQELNLSTFAADTGGKEMQTASFLTQLTPEKIASETTTEHTAEVELAWRGRLTGNISQPMSELLAPTLETYKLSSTHLANFLDVTNGGPQHFLLNNLLRFPQAKSPSAQYGTAIHATLQQAHDYLRAQHTTQPIEDILGNFEHILENQYLAPREHELYLARGVDALTRFLTDSYQSFTPIQRTEVSFAGQTVTLGDARLTGALDLADIDEKAKTIRVTDYKTGKPSRDWKGKTEYEKIKLHKYHQQLMFYQLLIENSRDYSKYRFDGGVLQFVEPTKSGDIIVLENTHSSDELDKFRHLITAVWHSIMTLDLPDTSQYESTLKGILQFEADIIDKYSKI